MTVPKFRTFFKGHELPHNLIKLSIIDFKFTIYYKEQTLTEFIQYSTFSDLVSISKHVG